MANFFAEYAGFLAKTATVIVAALIILAASIAMRQRGAAKGGEIKVKSLNNSLSDIRDALSVELMSKAELKAYNKAVKEENKADKPKGASNVFVLDFKGDIRASAVENLRHEVTAVLGSAKTTDEVVVRLESPGGSVDGYGLASSQLARIRNAGIPLTVCVDNVAASGGYMMACIGNKILSAPFAIIGSIGVVAQIPNINRLLKKHDVDIELITAGEFKRTLTVMGENTDEGRKKFKEDITVVHDLFKGHVSQYRPQLDIDAVATGATWYGDKAKEQKLVDEVMISDDYLTNLSATRNVYQVTFERPKGGLKKRLGMAAATVVDSAFDRLWTRLLNHRGY